MAQIVRLFPAGVKPVLNQSIPADADLLAVGGAANAAATITMTADTAAGTQRPHNLSAVCWSYSGAPTGGNLKIIDNANVTIVDLDITAGGFGGINFDPPLGLAMGATNAKVVLAAGGAGVTGKVFAAAYKLD